MTNTELKQMLPLVERSLARMRQRLAQTDDGVHAELQKLIDDLEALLKKLRSEADRRSSTV